MMMSITSPGPRTRRTYDHRLREHVVREGAGSLGRTRKSGMSTRAAGVSKGAGRNDE